MGILDGVYWPHTIVTIVLVSRHEATEMDTRQGNGREIKPAQILTHISKVMSETNQQGKLGAIACYDTEIPTLFCCYLLSILIPKSGRCFIKNTSFSSFFKFYNT